MMFHKLFLLTASDISVAGISGAGLVSLSATPESAAITSWSVCCGEESATCGSSGECLGRSSWIAC